MIKVNLLDSVTDRTHSVAAVEARVSDPRVRSWMMMAVVAGVTVMGIGVDYVSANYRHSEATQELARQEEISAKMKEVTKQQEDLRKKIDEVGKRIEAIKQLRASQKGPVAILSEINSRMPATRDFSLLAVEQKGGELTIEGHSSSEDAVTQFARALEFSSDIFRDVSISTERKPVEPSDTDWDKNVDGEIDADAPRPEVVKFKLTCKYGAEPAPAAGAPAQPKPAGAANQVAQN
jgi:Tfp pilus assembly protein PilN